MATTIAIRNSWFPTTWAGDILPTHTNICWHLVSDDQGDQLPRESIFRKRGGVLRIDERENLPRGAEKPRIEYPPVSFHWFSGPAFTSGIETPTVDGQKLRVYSAEKSVADAFKYRSKLDLDVTLETLRT